MTWNTNRPPKITKLHKALHTGEKPYMCPICDYHESYLCTTTHMTIHTDEKPIIGLDCDNLDHCTYIATHIGLMLISFLLISSISPKILNLSYIVNISQISTPQCIEL